MADASATFQAARSFLDPRYFEVAGSKAASWMSTPVITVPPAGQRSSSSSSGERAAAPVGMTYAQAAKKDERPLTMIAAGVVGIGIVGLVLYKLKKKR